MKIIHRLIITTITASLLLPITASAAKADRKKAAEPLPAYATIDPDSKGSVSKDQFVAALKEKLGSEDAAKTKFEALDKDSEASPAPPFLRTHCAELNAERVEPHDRCAR